MIRFGGLALAAVLLPRPAGAQIFESIDLKGECYGVPEKPGSTKELTSGKAWELEAYGSEFGHHCKTDQGRFVFQEMEGDFDVAARVVDVRNDAHTAAKACLMVRERADDPASRFAAIMAVADLPFARRHHHGFPDSFTFDFRVRPGGNLANEGFRYSGQDLKERRRYPNVWLRLKRQGDRITAFLSHDGVRWREQVPEESWVNLPTFPLGKRVAVGLCLSSEPEVKPDIRATARFDRLRGFRTTGGPRLPAAEGPREPVAFTALPTTPRRRPLGLGRPMPLADAKLDDLMGGAARSFAESAGAKGTLVVFDAAGCAHPDTAPKRLVAVARPFERKGVKTLFVRPRGAALPADKAALGSYPLLDDKEGALAGALGATAGGQVFVFDQEGKLLYSGAATGTDSTGRRRAFLKEALTAAAAGKFPDVAQTPPPECPLRAGN